MSIKTAARPMTAVPIQPRITIGQLEAIAPIADRLEAIKTITTIRVFLSF